MKKDAGESESGKSRAPQSDEDAVICQLEGIEEYLQTIACVSQGSDVEVEQKIQWYLATSRELSGLDKGQKEMMEGRIRWAVDVRREGKGTEREQTAEQGQGKQIRV